MHCFIPFLCGVYRLVTLASPKIIKFYARAADATLDWSTRSNNFQNYLCNRRASAQVFGFPYILVRIYIRINVKYSTYSVCV